MGAIETLNNIRAALIDRVTLDAVGAAGIGVMARLKLVGELAKIKIGLKDAGDGPLAAMKRLKAISRANQIRVELGAAAKIPEAEKPLLVPSGIKGESAPMPDPYATIETRPGTTEEQRQVGRDALFALFERVNRNQSTEDRPQLIGNRLIADFKTSGAANLVGQAVQDSDDMAAIAQVYRDPRFETFRAIFVDDGGKIVGESSYTSRMPGCVHFPKNTDIAEDIRADMDRFGATGIYLMHNHPSGKSDPSSADIHATRYIGEKIPAMKGHIVIDHNEYTVIDSAGRHQTRPIENTGFHATPSAPHPLLGTAISTPDSLVEAANQLKDQAEKSHVVIMTNVKGEVNLVFSLPPDMLEGIDTDESAKARLKAWLRKIGRNTGTGLRAFLVWNEKSGAVTTEQESTMSRLINGGVFTDIVYDSSKVMSANNRYYSFSPRNLTDPLRDGIKTTSSLPT
ncbi:MAG: JAB domain-containing protein, partial [Methylococcaceae bacterium]